MAGLSIDMALYRMKAYAGLLMESVVHQQKDVGQDIRALVEWIEYARPLVGCVTASAETINPFADIQNRHGYQAQRLDGLEPHQLQGMTDPKPKNPDDDPDMPPEPQPVEPAPGEAPAEDKPAA